LDERPRRVLTASMVIITIGKSASAAAGLPPDRLRNH
jgi:hypothetical protein